MVTRITLASGNIFYHSAENRAQFAVAFIVDTNLNFLGGFLADEADRKLAAFTKLQNVKIETTESVRVSEPEFDYDIEVPLEMLNLQRVKIDAFAAKLGAASHLFKNHFHKLISDLGDCDGTGSKAESCDDRKW
jgi:hypothetical protein